MNTEDFYNNLSLDDKFNKFFTFSLVVHGILLFGFLLKQTFLPSEHIIIQNAIRVDIVALPDKQEPAAGPQAPKPPVPAPSTASPPATKQSPPKADPAARLDPRKAQQDALNRLRQKEAIDQLMKSSSSVPPTPAATPSTIPASQRTLFAGNQVSQGDSVTGLERLAFDEYISVLRSRVQSNFSIPSWLLDSNFKAAVEVTIDGQGLILAKRLVRSSGNATFDSAALTAIDASSPFPPVPERLTRGWGRFTIQFNFPDNQ